MFSRMLGFAVLGVALCAFSIDAGAQKDKKDDTKLAGVTGTVANRSLQWRDYYQNVWNIPAVNSTKMYGKSYTATPIVYRLRRGESFTRWLQPGGIVGDLGLAGLIWWGYNGGNAAGTDNAPYAKYSFVQNASARDDTVGASEDSAGG